jgi:hypothetical protein
MKHSAKIMPLAMALSVTTAMVPQALAQTPPGRRRLLIPFGMNTRVQIPNGGRLERFVLFRKIARSPAMALFRRPWHPQAGSTVVSRTCLILHPKLSGQSSTSFTG